MVVTDQRYYVTLSNDLLPCAYYDFGADGKMLTIKDGIVAEDGGLYYYVNNERTRAGLIKIGDDYYYAKTGGVIVTSQTYWVTVNNDLLPCGYYDFDADGKIIFSSADGGSDEEKLNGIVEEDGGLYYYVDGVRTRAGLIKIGDDYYYAKTGGIIVTSQTYYVTLNNDLLPCANYEFAADGKLVMP